MSAKAIFRRTAQMIRHLPRLERADWIWNRARGTYEALLRIGSGGTTIRVGGVCDVRMPPEYAGAPWEEYEPAAVLALVGWVQRHPEGTVIDVGSGLGIMSACALATSPAVHVVAFDSDLASVRATQRLTSLVASGRIRTVHGFVAADHLSGQCLAEAERRTSERLGTSAVTGDAGTTKFVCLQDLVDGTPCHSLDGLFLPARVGRTAALLKVDIEGAEQIALQGGTGWLMATSPDLLLSVHPDALSQWGQSPAGLKSFLENLGYKVVLLGIDHEEHWYCEASSRELGVAVPATR